MHTCCYFPENDTLSPTQKCTFAQDLFHPVRIHSHTITFIIPHEGARPQWSEHSQHTAEELSGSSHSSIITWHLRQLLNPSRVTVYPSAPDLPRGWATGSVISASGFWETPSGKEQERYIDILQDNPFINHWMVL